MTEQDIITRVWLHLNAQGKRAMGDNGCQYRTKAGLACAVGCFLDDATAVAADKQDFASIGAIAHECRGLLPADLLPHVPFLGNLQRRHDTSYENLGGTWLDNWRDAMRNLAHDRGLTLPEVAT